MLETIMPCEKLCQNFRHIADDLSCSDQSGDNSNVLKTQIKSELLSEPKLMTRDELDDIDIDKDVLKGSGQIETADFTDLNLAIIHRGVDFQRTKVPACQNEIQPLLRNGNLRFSF